MWGWMGALTQELILAIPFGHCTQRDSASRTVERGVPFPPIHPLHGISQSIHIHPSAEVPQGAVPVAPSSDGGSQRRRKKKRRRKRRRGEDYDGEDGPVVVVRLGNVGPLVMNQPQIDSPLLFPKGEGGRDAEASSTDCSELSGQPESSSGAEESVPVEELEDTGTQVEDEEMFQGVLMRDAEVSAQRDILLPEIRAEKEVTMNAETKEVSTQSPPEMAVQVNVLVTSPVSHICQIQMPEMPMEKAVNDNNVEKMKEEKEKQTEEKEDVPVQKETPKQVRKNSGRGKNDNKHTSPPAKAATLMEKDPESEPVRVYIEKMEVLEPQLTISNSTELDPKSSMVPAPIGETINNLLKEDVSLQLPMVEKKVEMDKFPGISMIASDISEKKDLQNSTPKIIPESQKVEPPKALFPDSFIFKPEPYKHPMLKHSKREIKDDPLLNEGNIVLREVNNECTMVDKVKKSPSEEEPSVSRHFVDMPKRRTRLKKPPEKEETPETVLLSNEVTEKTSKPDVKNTISLEDGRKEKEIKNKPLESENLLTGVIGPTGDKEDSEMPAETLTEVVSKWLEENLDALPDTTKEIMEKTEEEKEAEEENMTGSKNGVGNPFPVPSSSLSEEMKSNECECENVAKHECVSNVCDSAISKDGPVKRVANHKIGEVLKSKDKYDEDGGRQSEESDESCEWEPMTVEIPKKNFGDLETWKRLWSGIGGSSEAIRSLSYRGADDEEEDEMRKVRESMCDPNASVAKYYCLGSRDTKSLSPEEGPVQSDIPVQTDSGVQSDVEDDSVTTAEEAFEE
ncbi:hypothetical protein J437_LFUL017134, partial [Ladona fulva]